MYLLYLVCVGNVSCARSDAHLMSTTPTFAVNISSMCKLQNTIVFHGRSPSSELYCVVNSLDADTEIHIDALPRYVIYSVKYHCVSNLPGTLWYGLSAGAKKLLSIELQNCRLTHIASNALTEITTLRRLVIQFEPLNGKGKGLCSHEYGPKNAAMSNTTKTVCLENFLWFSKGIFSGNKLLKNLTMDGVMLNNSIWTEIRELRNLQQLSFCGNNITVLPTDSLTKLTKLTTLSLYNNRINGLFKRTFASQYYLEILNLSLNRIKTIEKHAFDGLKSLQVLNIAGNQITVLHAGMFEPLYNVQQLDLSNNHIKTIELGLFSRLNILKELNLSKNNIHEISNDIFIRDGNLKLLDISYNNISAFHFTNRNAYRNYLSSTLETLFMQGNNIVTMDCSTLLMLPSLKTLDISNNTLHDVTIDIAELPKQLGALNIAENRISAFQIFSSNALDKRSSLQHLDIRHNKIATLSQIEIPKSAVIGLVRIFIGNNPFHCDCKMKWLHELITLHNGVAESYLIRDYESLFCHSIYRHNPGFLIDINPENFLCEYHASCPEMCKCYQSENSEDVNIVDCKNNNITTILDKMPGNCTVFDFSGNKVSTLRSSNLGKLSHLKELLINSSQVTEIDKGTFTNFSSLRKLDLAQNQLTVLKNGAFGGLDKLEALDISLNRIRRIEKGTFQSLISLIYLNIQGNELQTISAIEFEHFARIQSLSLSQNPWSCECSFLKLLKRFLNRNAKRIDDFDAITCEYFNKEKNMQLEHFLYAIHPTDFCVSDEVVYKILDQPLIISISVVLSVIVICVIVFIVAFRNRKFLRLWCFIKFHFRFGCRKEIGDDNRPYDAFLSYCSLDGRVIVHEIVPHLEEPRNGKQGYKLYVSDRDFPAGGSIAETIIHALNITKRVIVIVSDNYLQSEWCQYEFRQAHYQLIKEKSNRIIMIVLEELNPDLIYEEIGHYLKTRTYVKYDDPLLWPKVEYAMPDTLAVMNNRNQNQDDDRVEFIPLEVMSGNI